MSQLLHIGKGKHGFTLPLDLATATQAILARKRSGKSYTASVQAEELLAHGQQVIVFDPTSAWYGLRSSADGDGEGYSIVVFGGDHADAPLDFRTGKAMATAVVEHGFSAIFDIGNLHTEEQVQFVMDFSSELLRINRTALHVFMDEADTFAPQKPLGLLQNKCLGTVSRLVKQGGIRGIGFTMITQRPASMNKDVLSQVDILTVLRMSHPLDIKAATDWIKSEVTVDFAKEVEKALPSLPVGTAYFCSASLGLGQRVEVRERNTFNSGATPKPGERKAEPKVMAGVDIEKLGKEISASVQRTKEESPEYLKKRIADLETEIAKGGKVDMGVLEDVQRMEEELAELRPLRALQQKNQLLLTNLFIVGSELAQLDMALSKVRDRFNEAIGFDDSPYAVSAFPDIENAIEEARCSCPIPAEPKRSAPKPQHMARAERAILTVLAQFGPSSKAKTAAISGYSVGGGGFNNSISSCRTKGWLIGSDPLEITREGRSAVGSMLALPRGRALLEMWQAKVGKAEREILGVLARHRRLSKEKLAELAGYAPTGGGFNNSLSSLRTLELISGSRDIELTPDFAEAIR